MFPARSSPALPAGPRCHAPCGQKPCSFGLPEGPAIQYDSRPALRPMRTPTFSLPTETARQ